MGSKKVFHDKAKTILTVISPHTRKSPLTLPLSSEFGGEGGVRGDCAYNIFPTFR
jgi:hypothetical protein